ncbi:MAG: TIGR01459 family HAD-type hydrolase [Asticcacaulis sp.]
METLPNQVLTHPAPIALSGLSEIADRYDAILCDVWGVIHNGRHHFPEACEALIRFQETRGPVLLISNSPRPSADLQAQMRALSVPDTAWSATVSSGDATRFELLARAPGKAWVIGDARESSLYADSGLDLSGTPEDADFISCTSPYNDESDVPEDYRTRFEVAIARNLTMICANPDRIVQRGDRLILCAGALADLYAAMGGQVIMAGKPFAPIYEQSLARLEALKGAPIARSRILAIGDGLPTDILGANDQDLDVLLITSGIHAEEATGPDGRMDTDRVQAMLHNAKASATYAALALTW